ncbi:MAG: DUF4230 domain-containing protein [Chthoniobacterales bacterium]
MNDPKPRLARRVSWPLVFLLIFVSAALLGGFIFWRIETWPVRNAHAASAELEKLARKTRDAFISLAQLQPRITIHDRVYFEQTSPVAELAILSRQTEVDHEFLHTWAGSTKRLQVHGTFNIKAGFDLHDNFTVDVREKEIVVGLPHAKILSVEETKMDVAEFENGLWNRISAEDVEKEISALPALAREKAARSEMLPEAETSLREQLEARLGTERPVRLVFPPNETKKP